jgi:hypothetical protein
VTAQAHPAGKNVLVFTRPAVAADAAPLAAQMRPEDLGEHAAQGDPVEVLREGIRESAWCYLAEDREGYIAAWGVQRIGTLLGGEGFCWCATTPRVLRHRRAFLLGSRAWVAAMQAEFTLLAGWCAADYVVSHRWLTRWLGFHLGATTLIGGVPFVNFWWGRM